MNTRTSRTSKKKPAQRSRGSAKKAPRTGTRPSLRNIARQEKGPKRAAGWTVSLTRRGKNMFKSFADSKFGGKTKALKAAKAWREQRVKSTSDADYVLWRRAKRSRPSGSGIVGVGRYAVLYERSRHLVWEAYWQDADGKRYSRRFFVSVHGERGAKALASAARRQGIEELRQELIRRGKTSG
jgi:AP2 domain